MTLGQTELLQGASGFGKYPRKKKSNVSKITDRNNIKYVVGIMLGISANISNGFYY